MYIFNAKKATDACIEWIQDWFNENGKGCNAVIGISGGKDSTVVAALCMKALGRDRVIGVMLPDGIQPDIADSREIIRNLGIHGTEYNIGDASTAMVENLSAVKVLAGQLGFLEIPSRQARENLPPRLRMAALYMIAQNFNGRVSNNCNLSENWIGYSTIYGDTAGDFSPISCFTASEVVAIGRVLGIPERFLIKPPSDGLCGQTDEDKLGFTYKLLDEYLREPDLYMEAAIEGRNISQSEKDTIRAAIEKINRLHRQNSFKHMPMAAFNMPMAAFKWGTPCMEW